MWAYDEQVSQKRYSYLGLLTGFVCVAEAMDENNGSAIVGTKGAVVEGFII